MSPSSNMPRAHFNRVEALAHGQRGHGGRLRRVDQHRTGDVTLGGNVANSGAITLSGGGITAYSSPNTSGNGANWTFNAGCSTATFIPRPSGALGAPSIF